MPRKKRQLSNTGIYHVMLRGINKQDIFFDRDDFLQMMSAIAFAPYRADATGKIVSHNECTIYAYCILANHVHILLKDGEKNVSQIMQKIEDRYVFFYNKKYERVGHLFQARFRSEPVNDAEYFHRLLRYIHRNPVKAGDCMKPEEYPYSSWLEYLKTEETPLISVCSRSGIEHVISRYTYNNIVEWVNMDIDDNCMDIDSEQHSLSDQQAWAILSDISKCTNPEYFKQLPAPEQLRFIRRALAQGISIRQASRLGTLSYYMIRKSLNSQDFNANLSIKGSDPSVELFALKLHEQIDEMVEIREDTRHKIHIITDYLLANPSSLTNRISEHAGLTTARTRMILSIMMNKGIVVGSDALRYRTYSIKYTNPSDR